MEEDYKNNIGFLIHDVARLMRNLFDLTMKEGWSTLFFS